MFRYEPYDFMQYECDEPDGTTSIIPARSRQLTDDVIIRAMPFDRTGDSWLVEARTKAGRISYGLFGAGGCMEDIELNDDRIPDGIRVNFC